MRRVETGNCRHLPTRDIQLNSRPFPTLMRIAPLFTAPSVAYCSYRGDLSCRKPYAHGLTPKSRSNSNSRPKAMDRTPASSCVTSWPTTSNQPSTASPTFLTSNIHRKTWSAFGNSFSDGMSSAISCGMRSCMCSGYSIGEWTEARFHHAKLLCSGMKRPE